MFRILAFAFVAQVSAFFIYEQNVIDRGFCHQQDVKIAVNINCSASVNASLFVSVIKDRTLTDQNYNLQCPYKISNELQCFDGDMKGIPNAINNTLDIKFTFNNTVYAGRYLRITVLCNDSKKVQDILLKPCVSGFTSSAAFYNTTTVSLRCDHLDFNYSNTPLRMIEKGENDHGYCLRNNSCTPGCERLSNGMHCFVPYTSGIIYQCELGGAVYNITDEDTVPTPLPDTTTTTQRTTTTVRPTGTTTRRTTVRTHGTSHKTTKSSHGSTTSLQSTGVNNMASIYVVGLLIAVFI